MDVPLAPDGVQLRIDKITPYCDSKSIEGGLDASAFQSQQPLMMLGLVAPLTRQAELNGTTVISKIVHTV